MSSKESIQIVSTIMGDKLNHYLHLINNINKVSNNADFVFSKLKEPLKEINENL